MTMLVVEAVWNDNSWSDGSVVVHTLQFQWCPGYSNGCNSSPAKHYI